MATYLQGSYETSSGVCLFHMVASCILDQQVMQNAALRTAPGCTQDTNIQHMHGETLTFPIHKHLQLHVLQYKQKTQHSKARNPLFLTTAATQQTFPQTPHSHYNRLKNKHAPFTYIHYIYCL